MSIFRRRGVDSAVLASFFEQSRGTLLGLFDMFAGGALRQFSVFSLGIMPYISASIILELLTVVIPHLERLKKEGEAGRKKITAYTRYGTVVLSSIQGFAIAVGLEGMSFGGQMVVITPGWGFRLMTVITLTAGTAFIMWLGEQINERGIGNGISLIIFAGIVAGFAYRGRRDPGHDNVRGNGNLLRAAPHRFHGSGGGRHRLLRARATPDTGAIRQTIWSAGGLWAGRAPTFP